MWAESADECDDDGALLLNWHVVVTDETMKALVAPKPSADTRQRFLMRFADDCAEKQSPETNQTTGWK